MNENTKSDAGLPVLFEVTPKKEYKDDYLRLAAALKSEIEKADGFNRSERFESLNSRGKLLSLSVWESESAVSRWRNTAAHRACQKEGHFALFEDYRITVAAPIREYSIDDRRHAPDDSDAFLKSE